MLDKHSREWWKERLPLIQQFVEGKQITVNDSDPLEAASFDGDPEVYTVLKPKDKWLKTMWVKEKDFTPPRYLMITGVSFSEGRKEYRVSGFSFLPEAIMNKEFEPCEKPE